MRVFLLPVFYQPLTSEYRCNCRQLAEQYGNEIAGDVISKSKSSSQLGMQLDGAPKLPYLSSGNVVGMGMSASAGTSVTKVEPYGSGTPPGKI